MRRSSQKRHVGSWAWFKVVRKQGNTLGSEHLGLLTPEPFQHQSIPHRWSAESIHNVLPRFEPGRNLNQIEFHWTSKHGSCLKMAETDISIMGRQCLGRRLDNRSLMADELAAWEDARIARKTRIHWTFAPPLARQKLSKLYPSIEG